MSTERPSTEKQNYRHWPHLEIQKVRGSSAFFRVPNTPAELNEHWFDPAHWEAQNKTIDRRTGRNTAYFFQENNSAYVLRHYWRGGFIRKLVARSYLFTGIRRSRMYRELDLLAKLDEMHLPVSRPISAILTRHGLLYRGSIITQAIPNASNLLEILSRRELTTQKIDAIAKLQAAFHRKGVDHADLNIGNILLDTEGQPYLVDFDRGRIRQPNPGWQKANIQRLQRSFTKQKRLNQDLPWTYDHWHCLMTTYADEMSG